jgi:hypothetical protein
MTRLAVDVDIGNAAFPQIISAADAGDAAQIVRRCALVRGPAVHEQRFEGVDGALTGNEDIDLTHDASRGKCEPVSIKRAAFEHHERNLLPAEPIEGRSHLPPMKMGLRPGQLRRIIIRILILLSMPHWALALALIGKDPTVARSSKLDANDVHL